MMTWKVTARVIEALGVRRSGGPPAQGFKVDDNGEVVTRKGESESFKNVRVSSLQR